MKAHRYTVITGDAEVTAECLDCDMANAQIIAGPRGYTKGVVVEALRRRHVANGMKLNKRPSKDYT